MLNWEEKEPYGSKLHVWENQHGEELYVRDRYDGYRFRGDALKRYEVGMMIESHSAFNWNAVYQYGKFADESDAVDHAVNVIMGQDTGDEL